MNYPINFVIFIHNNIRKAYSFTLKQNKPFLSNYFLTININLQAIWILIIIRTLNISIKNTTLRSPLRFLIPSYTHALAHSAIIILTLAHVEETHYTAASSHLNSIRSSAPCSSMKRTSQTIYKNGFLAFVVRKSVSIAVLITVTNACDSLCRYRRSWCTKGN